MKFLKFRALFLMLTSFSFFFYSCGETTSTADNPVIESIDPTSGTPGTVVTIKGSLFGDYNESTSKVYFNGELATNIVVDGNQIQWFDDEIKVKVPARATTGNVVVEANGLLSNGFPFTVPTVAPVTDLMATSKDDKSVLLKWTASADADITGYGIFIYPLNGTAPEDPIQIAKGVTTYLATGLTEGTVYNFDVHALKGNILSPKSTVKWSPASRFIYNINDAEIKVYETKSNLGSGLQLFDATGGAPKTLKIASHTEWDLGLFISGTNIWFGSASKMKTHYPTSFTGAAKPCQMATNKYFFNSLEELFDSQALDSQTFSDSEVDLSTLTEGKNVIFIVRTNSPTWNYAKVMVLYKGGKYLQGTADDRYIEVQVSYQKTAGVPYAL